MEIKPMKTESDFQAALTEVDRLWDTKPNTPKGDLLEAWTALIEVYEEQHYSLPLPDPIDAIRYWMESRGLSRRDL